MDNNEIKHPVVLYIYRHWIINVLFFLLVCTCIFVKIFYFTQKEYTATTSIIPSAANFSNTISSQLGAIAGLTGINLANSSGQSQEMYRGILNSRRLLESILLDTFEVRLDSSIKREPLIIFLNFQATNHSDSLEKALKKMREKVVNISIDVDNNILNLSVTLLNPILASNVSNRMVELLDDIVVNQVQKEYRIQYEYLQRRLVETEENLKIAEENLKVFLQKVKIVNEPKNQIAELRIKREIELQTAIYTELQKQKETFILQNMINLSPVKVLDKAEPPFRKSRPKRLLMLISLCALAGCIQIGMNGSIILFRKLKSDVMRNNLATDK